MARERRTKTVTYKQAKFHASKSSLKTLLTNSLKKRRKVGERRQAMGPDDEPPIWRVIGQFKPEGDFLFGILVQYSPGTNPMFAIDDQEADSLTVEQMAAPPTKDGKAREPLDGMLFFAVLENHVVMLQASALRTRHLEQHLMWLLHDARTLEGTDTLSLIDLPPLKTRRKLEQHPIREVDIGGELLPSEAVERAIDEAEDEGVTVRQEVKSVEFQNAIGSDRLTEFLLSFLKKDEAAKLPLEDLAGSNIEYTLKLRYNRTTTERGQKLMNTLGKALRNASGVDTVLHLKGGGKITSKELRLGGPVRIDTYNGVPSAEDVFEILRKWLLEKVQSGDVVAL